MMVSRSRAGSTSISPARTRHARRRLAQTVGTSDLKAAMAYGEGAEGLLSALGRLAMIWHNTVMNLRSRVAAMGGPRVGQSASATQLIRALRSVPIEPDLKRHWDHMIEYFDILREHRNALIHGASSTYDNKTLGVIEAYIIHDRHSEHVYEQDINELTAHFFRFGRFSGELLFRGAASAGKIPDPPKLPPRWRE